LGSDRCLCVKIFMRPYNILFPFLLALAGCMDESLVDADKQRESLIYNTDNSPLPDNQVQAIAVDKNDVKWIGTSNGLARFSNKSWTVYDTINSGLHSQFVTAIALDKNGDVFIGTARGLTIYDGTTWKACSSLKNAFITKILYDEKTDVVWVGTDKGLCRYDGSIWQRYDDPNSSLIDGHINSLAVDQNGTLFVGSFDYYSFIGRLLKFDGVTWTSTRLDWKELPSSFPDALLVDADNVVWMGVKGTMGGMMVRIHDDDWKIFNRLNTDCAAISGGINAIEVQGATKWIASGNGLIEYNGTTWRYYNANNSMLPDNYIFALAIDKNGDKWIGTLTGGLVLFK
jgi:ligand-binding sensor domain-containing protein